MQKITVCLTDEQAKQFLDAIEILNPVEGYETPEAMANSLIEEFCQNMDVAWTYGKAEGEEVNS